MWVCAKVAALDLDCVTVPLSAYRKCCKAVLMGSDKLSGHSMVFSCMYIPNEGDRGPGLNGAEVAGGALCACMQMEEREGERCVCVCVCVCVHVVV